MRLRINILIPLWVVLYNLLAGLSFAGEEQHENPHKPPSFGSPWASFRRSYSKNLGTTIEGTASDPDTFFENTNLTVEENPQQGTATATAADAEGTIQLSVVAKNRKKAASSSSASKLPWKAAALSVCFILLLSAKLLAGAAITKPSKGAPSSDPLLTAAAEKLEKVKLLLAPAKKLVSAVNTREAEAFYKKAAEKVDNAGIAVAAAAAQQKQQRRVGDIKIFDSLIDQALVNLKLLHQAANTRAEALLAAAVASAPLEDDLEHWEKGSKKVFSDLGDDAVNDTVQPFMHTARSLRQNIKELSKRIEKAGERMLKRRLFNSEEDGELLLGAAADLWWIQSTSEQRWRTIEMTHQVQKCTEDAVQSVLLSERDAVMWNINQNLGILCARVALAINEGEDDDGGATDSDLSILSGGPAAAAIAPTAKEEEKEEGKGLSEGVGPSSTQSKPLEYLQNKIAEITELNHQLQLHRLVLQSATTPKEMLDANFHSIVLEKEISDLLENAAEVANSLPGVPNELDEGGSQAMAQVGHWLGGSFKSERLSFYNALQDAERWAKILDDESKAGTGHFGAKLVQSQTERLREIAGRAASREGAIIHSSIMLERPRLIDESLKHIGQAVFHLRSQMVDREALRLLGQSCHFLQLVENNLVYVEAAADQISPFSMYLEGPDKAHYDRLYKGLTDAKAALRKATTLGKATKAAAKIRANASAIQDLLFRFVGKTDPAEAKQEVELTVPFAEEEEEEEEEDGPE